jgi:hypothetical protein
VRLSEAERAQIAAAEGFQNMPLSSYVGCAALQHSAVAVGKATVAPRPRPVSPRAEPTPERKVPARKLLVIDPAPPKREHYVDGELVRR